MKPWYASAIGRVLILLFVIALFALSSLAKAATVEFPEEELSRESVYPVFDQPDAVKKRNVPTEDRIELGLFGGAALNDPFLNIYTFGVEGLYHLSEMNAVGIYGVLASSSNASYVDTLQHDVQGSNIKFALNPAPQYMLMGEYEFTPYYGKISLTKPGVLNLNLSGVVRAGMMGLNPSDSSIAGSIGIVQRFFFSANFGVKIDLSMLFYSKTDVIPTNVNPSKSLVNTVFLTVGALWYLPTL